MTIHALPSSVRILLPADALFVIDVLRRFERFRNGYDQRHLDAAAASIRDRLGDGAVDGLMSDALLLDNELRLRTSGDFEFMAEGVPTATDGEITLLRMIAALQDGSFKLAGQDAADLEIVQSRALLMLANKFASRLASHGLRLSRNMLGPNWSARPIAPQRPAGGKAPELRVVATMAG
ncbi:hypothetical protein SLNSH_10170 [Alsobacter soli]|uniref:Uncharacterized protein n=1 Tax=Alsobacter soli TaxID=2109933 RepID=A0A2T1HUA3_9HYPH|nr:hypothetical protein [Alsobacter soli]PSC05170.1 hypothetical protein SLNSH_10170 [Alsobacter soli]